MRAPWLAEVLQDAGLAVTELDGWKGRGGAMTAIHGCVIHHTVTGPQLSAQRTAELLRDGRPDLKGPLSQLGLDRTGMYWVIADGRSSHNGYGRWGNDSIGIEGFNDGVGEAWPGVQIDAFQRGSAAICERAFLTPDRVLGHKETDPTRKVDPRGIDMNQFRAAVARLLSDDGGFLMALTDQQQSEVHEWLRRLYGDAYQGEQLDGSKLRGKITNHSLRVLVETTAHRVAAMEKAIAALQAPGG